jgi:rRNA maturation RNase YbeY
MTRIRIQNRQRGYRLDRAALLRLGGALLACAARTAPHRVWSEVLLLIVDDAGIAPINAAVMGHDRATDVLTLAYESIPGEPAGATAELVLNAERAWQQGGGRREADRELALYLAHAVDHLCGFDDHTPADRRSMRRREWRWLRQVGIPEIFLS